MKRTLWFVASLVLLLMVVSIGGALAGDGIGFPRGPMPSNGVSLQPSPMPYDDYEFLDLSAVGNTAEEFLGWPATTHSCEVYRTGSSAVVITLQGSNSSGAGFTNVTTNRTISTTADDTWYIGAVNEPARYIRGRCVSGCDGSNTISIVNCTSGGGAQ